MGQLSPMISFTLIFAGSVLLVNSENVLLTEVFEIILTPSMFNWTYEGIPNQFVYQPSLQNAPDLPSWINYHYSEKRHAGYLYGVPPSDVQHIELEIVALNRKNYETRVRTLPIHVDEKLNPARNEVQLKIDNVNVEDMFDADRMERMKDIFRKVLWKSSQEDLYVTFLASAIQMGARLPANPSEGEGVVLNIGSSTDFSQDLLNLQNEVRPLWRFKSCPRDYKRTTVERYFRDEGFALDWCAFKLIEDNSSAINRNEEEVVEEEQWKSISKSEVPKRSYIPELSFIMPVSLVVLSVFALILSFILCFHHEGIDDPGSEEFFDNIFHICIDYCKRSKDFEDAPSAAANQYEAIRRATQSLRSLSNARDMSLSPELSIKSRSHTASPTSTLARGIHCRPSPPPYVRPKYKQEL